MTATVEQVDLWRAAPAETQNLEFKEAKTQFDNEKLLEYCVAIANEGGGVLLLGITDKPPRRVTGTRAFSNPSKTSTQILQTLGFRVDIEEVSHPGGRVLVFQIPSRLKGSAYALHGAYLMRCGESLVPMTEERLRAIFGENKEDWLEEHSKTGLDAQQVIDLLDTQSFFDLLHLPYPTNRDGVIDRLKQLELIDSEGSNYSIRRMAALMLAKNLGQFPELVRKAPRIVVYKGASKLETTNDAVSNKGYAVGFQSLVNWVCDFLPQNEVIRDALRASAKLVPDGVIRELLANALIHQDFEIGGTSMIVEIYSNRIEFSNPGVPLVPVERFIDGCQSRNERFASLMRRLGVCEEKGSGIDSVIFAAEIHQLPAPEFRVGYQATHVTIYGPRVFGQMNKQDRIRACYQHCALKYVMSERMTNQSLRERFKLPQSKSSSVSQIIAQTEDTGIIKVDQNTGSRKYVRYVPIWA